MKLDSTAVIEGADRALVLEMNHADSRPMILEATAFTIWQEIDGESDTDAIVQRLSQRQGLNADLIRPDVEAFLLRLARDHVIASLIPPSSVSERPRE
ncbi:MULTISPECIES: PqqD family protein [unclassified Rathayibacter]|uniref:PqqD family protein n=1 Tax=unclassified Rathayibacter TaxID=2609250 RepID=UPI0006F2DC38|nr:MULTISPECIES: PqqD family protein [unclassified Rathayibacter]KQQ00909.1 hypothetical protein ASF42_16525 [Rathayibacter sp. Leaf294]KQS10312.1 hypothetical protein ASG06_16525 [Rathayibacter sp. Leaf185]